MKKELQFKGVFENGKFKPTQIKITKKIAQCKENKHLNLEPGYVAFGPIGGQGCGNGCPADTNEGYHICVSGNCVFVPNS